MTPNEIAEEIQAQLLSAAQVVQDSVVTTVEWVGEKAETIIPQTSARLTNRLPQPTAAQSSCCAAAPGLPKTSHRRRLLETAAEQLLRSQHEFASKIATALTSTAPTPTA